MVGADHQTIWSPGIRSRRRHRPQAARSPLVRVPGLGVTTDAKRAYGLLIGYP